MSKRAQSILEIISLISLVTFAWLAMYGYFKSALQGNWKKNIEMFSDNQYEPGITEEKSLVKYVNPQIRAMAQDINTTFSITRNCKVTRLQNFPAKILKIEGWGRYYDEDEPD